MNAAGKSREFVSHKYLHMLVGAALAAGITLATGMGAYAMSQHLAAPHPATVVAINDAKQELRQDIDGVRQEVAEVRQKIAAVDRRVNEIFQFLLDQALKQAAKDAGFEGAVK